MILGVILLGWTFAFFFLGLTIGMEMGERRMRMAALRFMRLSQRIEEAIGKKI